MDPVIGVSGYREGQSMLYSFIALVKPSGKQSGVITFDELSFSGDRPMSDELDSKSLCS